MICYLDQKKKNKGEDYPKCELCGLPGHLKSDCDPLVNIAVGQAFLQKNPTVLKEILSKNKQFWLGRRNGPKNKGGKKHNKSIHLITELAEALQLDSDP